MALYCSNPVAAPVFNSWLWLFQYWLWQLQSLWLCHPLVSPYLVFKEIVALVIRGGSTSAVATNFGSFNLILFSSDHQCDCTFVTHQRHIGDSPSTQVGSHVHFNLLLATLVSPQSTLICHWCHLSLRPSLVGLSVVLCGKFPAGPAHLCSFQWFPRAQHPWLVLSLTYPVWNREVVLVPSGPTTLHHFPSQSHLV